jgi:hypothetical protein
VSSALPSLLSSSPIVVALKLHSVLASTTHPLPFPITPRQPHRRSSRPRAPATSSWTGPSALRPNWPYHCDPLPPPVPCHHSIVIEPGSQRRTAADLTGGRAPIGSPPPPPSPPPSVVSLPLPLAHGPVPMAPSPRRPRVVPPLAGPVARLPTRQCAPALGWAEFPLGPAS